MMRNYRNFIFTIAIVGLLLHIRPASSRSASVLGGRNPRPRRRSVVPTGRRPTKERQRRRARRRSEEEEYACAGSSITTGEYRVQNTHLCYTNTDNDEMSTFGINSNGELVYVVKWVNYSNVNLCACMCVRFLTCLGDDTRESDDEGIGKGLVRFVELSVCFLFPSRLFDLW